jgi:hypothetical protein
MSSPRLFAVFTAVHFPLSLGAFLFGGELVIANFDGEQGPIGMLVALVAGLGMLILPFPLLNYFSALIDIPRGEGTPTAYVVLLLNSMAWAAAITLVRRWWRSYRQRQTRGA